MLRLRVFENFTCCNWLKDFEFSSIYSSPSDAFVDFWGLFHCRFFRSTSLDSREFMADFMISGKSMIDSWMDKTHRRNFWTRTNSAMSALSTLEIWVDIQIWRGVSWPNLKDRQDAKISQKVKTKRHGNCLELEPLWTNSHLILNFHVFFVEVVPSVWQWSDLERRCSTRSRCHRHSDLFHTPGLRVDVQFGENVAFFYEKWLKMSKCRKCLCNFVECLDFWKCWPQAAVKCAACFVGVQQIETSWSPNMAAPSAWWNSHRIDELRSRPVAISWWLHPYRSYSFGRRITRNPNNLLRDNDLWICFNNPHKTSDRKEWELLIDFKK